MKWVFEVVNKNNFVYFKEGILLIRNLLDKLYDNVFILSKEFRNLFSDSLDSWKFLINIWNGYSLEGRWKGI